MMLKAGEQLGLRILKSFQVRQQKLGVYFWVIKQPQKKSKAF